MDHLIQHLDSTDSIAVLQTDYVLDVMSRADVPLDSLNEADIHKLFQVSGAGLIVDVRLSGNPGDYQFVYKLIRPATQKTGTTISVTLNQGIDTVALAVSKQLGQSLKVPDSYQSSFSDELLASGLAVMYDNPTHALTFYDAALIAKPTNITAFRLALQTALMANDIPSANYLLTQSVAILASSNNDIERLRVLFFKAAVHAQKQNFESALDLLSDAEVLAKTHKDWLFLAYTMELKGQIVQHNGNFHYAQALYQKALEYHDILQCPLGRSNNLVFLSKLAHQQNNIKQAQSLAKEAAELVKLRQLQQSNPEALRWYQSIAPSSSIIRGD